MKDLAASIVESLDGTQVELFPYLPYILQDLWEMGADPAVMLTLLRNNINDRPLKILDLGCGKGPVSINIARELDCMIKGIDAMSEFIESAKDYARKFNVQDKCDFETGDIRTNISEQKGYDVIILGAIGPILGDLQTTLRILAQSLNRPGYVLLDDGYIVDESESDYNRCLRKTEFYRQIASSGFDIVQEIILEKDQVENMNESAYDPIKNRINELKIKHPNKSELFERYLESQEYENYHIENEIICGTWLLKTIAAIED